MTHLTYRPLYRRELPVMIPCPICKLAAEEIEQGTFDGLVLRCERHGELEITSNAWAQMGAADSLKWQKALEKAIGHVAPGARPRIYVYDFF